MDFHHFWLVSWPARLTKFINKWAPWNLMNGKYCTIELMHFSFIMQIYECILHSVFRQKIVLKPIEFEWVS